MSTIGELAGLSRPQLIERVRELESKLVSVGAELDFALRLVESTAAEGLRAEQRRACWALAAAFGALDLERTPWDDGLYAEPCRCGHPRDYHEALERHCDDCSCDAFASAAEVRS